MVSVSRDCGDIVILEHLMGDFWVGNMTIYRK